jgi:hypothetical protein
MRIIRIIKEIAALAFVFSLWTAIPAALLYPCALWRAKHTLFSQDTLANIYFAGIGLLLIPTALLVDFLYQRFRSENRPELRKNCEK